LNNILHKIIGLRQIAFYKQHTLMVNAHIECETIFHFMRLV